MGGCRQLKIKIEVEIFLSESGESPVTVNDLRMEEFFVMLSVHADSKSWFCLLVQDQKEKITSVTTFVDPFTFRKQDMNCYKLYYDQITQTEGT